MRAIVRTLAGAAALAICLTARGQLANPVYPDDSPSARDTLVRVAEFAESGNEGEAVRELQRLLDEQPDRVVASPEDPDLFLSVRAMVHRTLLASPPLLERYRATEGPRAEQELAAGAHGAVEATRLLTRAGFEATLRVAQERLEGGELEAARLTLEQLEEHPDRRGTPLGADAANLMRLIGRYLDRPEIWERAGRWATEAGADADGPRAPVALPPSLTAPRATLLEPAAATEAKALPPEPLWTAPLGGGEGREGPTDAIAQPGGRDDAAAGLWVLPAVVGDTVYVNDGEWITASDRFTLRPRWSIRPPGGAADPRNRADRALRSRTLMLGRQIEDTMSVSATPGGRLLVATTGIAVSGSRMGNPRTHGILGATGEVLWSVDVADLDPQLQDAMVRGPALLDERGGGTAVLIARKSAQGRRIVSVAMVGLSLESGKLRWVRPIASAGAMPLRSDMRYSDIGLLHRGVAYMSDGLGVAAAVEAATGRPVWVRRMPVVERPTSDHGNPWMWNAPVADGGTVVLLTPDRRDVVRIEAASGRVLERRAAGLLGDPAYLLRAGDWLAAVSSARVALLPMADLATGAVRLTRSVPGPGIRGRVVVSGQRLIVPLEGGLTELDPAAPGAEARVLAAGTTGHALPLASQLLVVGEGTLHSFLTWEVAEKLLRERMDADPADAAPAVTYAELAYRTGHPELIGGAADRAIAAIERDPAAPASRTERLRLFESLRAMAEASQGTDPRGEEARPGRPALDVATLEGVVRRMELAADDNDQRVSHLMILGRLREMQEKPALAAEAYQRVLAHPTLAAATWRGSGTAVRAELEATRRVRRLVLEHGEGAYAAFDAEARDRAGALAARASAEELEALARQYPAAAIGPELWLRAADLHEVAGRSQSAIAALREGLASAEASLGAGRADPPLAAGVGTVTGELAGRMITLLEGEEQVFAAAQLLRRLSEDLPGLALSVHGEPLDTERLGGELLNRLARLERLPRIGESLSPEVQVLRGWSLMAPLAREGAAKAGEHAMMYSESRSEVALWGIGTGGRDPSGGPAWVQQLWTRSYEGRPPVLLRLDPEAAYLYWPATRGGTIERVDALSGSTRWRTGPFGELFPAAGAPRRGDRFDAPLDGPVRSTDLLVAIDEQVVMLVERSGRAAAFDPTDGRLLWTVVGPVAQVHDADAGAGVVAIGGAAAGGRPGVEGEPLVTVYEARTGRLMQRIERPGSPVRWLRLAESEDGGRLIVGLESHLLAVNPADGKTVWTVSGHPGLASQDAWVLGSRLYVLDLNRSLWQVSLETGRTGEGPLDTGEHLEVGGLIEASLIGDLAAFSTTAGVVMFDPAGTLVGMDALDGTTMVLPPAPSESLLVALESEPSLLDDDRPIYALHLLDTTSAMLRATHRLVLWDTPRRIGVLDGRIVLTAGEVTLVLGAPWGDR